MVFVVLASVVGIAALVRLITRKDLCLCLFAVVPGIVGVLYVAALFGGLRPAGRGLFYGGIAAGAAAITLGIFRRDSRALLADMVSPGPLLFLVAAAAYWACYREHAFFWWDEFSHWGPAAQELIFTKGLPGSGTWLAFQDYPPGSALFEYFFAVNSQDSEAVIAFAHFILLAAPLTVLFAGQRWKQAHWVGLTLALVLLLVFTRGYEFLSIYVDSLLSVYFGVTLVVWLGSTSWSTAAYVIPSLFMLPLLKKAGYYMALVSAAVIVVDACLRLAAANSSGGQTLRSILGTMALRIGLAIKWIWEFTRASRAAILLLVLLPLTAVLGAFVDGFLAVGLFIVVCVMAFLVSPSRWFAAVAAFRRTGTVGTCAIWAALAFAPFASHYSWQHWVRGNALRSTFAMRPWQSYSDVVHAFGESPTERETGTLKAFMERFRRARLSAYDTTLYSALRKRAALFERIDPPRLSASYWSVCILGLFALAAWTAGTGAAPRMRLAAAGSIVFISYAVYMLGLLANYIQAFTKVEGLRVAGFERYAWTYLMGMALLACGLLALHARRGDAASPAQRKSAMAGVLLLTAYLYVFENPRAFIVPPASGAPRVEIREEIRPRVEFVRRHTSADDRVFIVYQGKNGLEFWVTRYELMPRQCNLKDWSLGMFFYKGSWLGSRLSPDHWKQMLARYCYSHVFVAQADGEFWATYGQIFDTGSNEGDFLFRVTASADNEIHLTPVR